MRSIKLAIAIPAHRRGSSDPACLVLGIHLLPRPPTVRSYGPAARHPGSRAPDHAACFRTGGCASQRDLLLPVVFESAARRAVHALDSGRAPAAAGPRIALLSRSRAVLERRPACSALPDGG